MDFFTTVKKNKKIDDKYNLKINKLIYTPKGNTPLICELFDNTFYKNLLKKINESSISEEEKNFLIIAAHRHIVFNYSKIADYYAGASKQMQELMEDSALVIIDFKKAIELGYVDLSLEIAKQYMQDKNNG